MPYCLGTKGYVSKENRENEAKQVRENRGGRMVLKRDRRGERERKESRANWTRPKRVGWPLGRR